ncbi:MAG: tRNA(Met) cytidine acetyltransferase TmcA [Haloarculaceae archaeon]
MLRELAADLRAEARATDERRLLVLAGDRDHTAAALADAVAGADLPLAETALLSERDLLACERHPPRRAGRLLGTTRTGVVLDCHDACAPNAVGRAVGAVDGGGLLVVLAPPLADWPDRRDDFDRTLAVPPYGVDDVAGNFRRRLVSLLYAHRGVAVVDVDADVVERDGLTGATGPPRRGDPPTPPADAAFPDAAYEACRTGDQVDAVAALEALRDPGSAVVVEADRGRGKSSAAGIAAGALAAEGRDVLVTAPAYESAREVFVRARALLARLGALASADGDPPRRIESDGGRVRYAGPDRAVDLPDDPDVVVVDEAAALPVHRLAAFLDAPAVAYATTVHGYEGAGRGFSVRFRDRLAASDRAVGEVTLATPIRYAPGDPVEVWAFRALLLDARPPVDALVADATPADATYRLLRPADLLADERLLREAFGLLVLAHYRTEPDDLARLLDAPNLSARALLVDGHVAAVALLAEEGGLDAETRRRMYEGERVPGNMVPDLLTAQLRDEVAASTRGLRVVRIATHPAIRSRGLGSRLLAGVRAEARERDLDWVGTGFGATPGLLRFWGANGYATVHLSTSRNETSGEYSALMLDPLTDAGRALRDRHAAWFADRAAAMLSDPLRDADPDVVRATLRTVGAGVALDLSDHEWTVLASAGAGPAHLSTDPGPFRRLAVKHLVDGDPDRLDAAAERLLVARVLQARSADEVAAALGYPSARQCMRALGEAVETLVRAYGPASARRELDRYG